jgi:hypothetical protein
MVTLVNEHSFIALVGFSLALVVRRVNRQAVQIAFAR